jgi:hypothetical protein
MPGRNGRHAPDKEIEREVAEARREYRRASYRATRMRDVLAVLSGAGGQAPETPPPATDGSPST